VTFTVRMRFKKGVRIKTTVRDQPSLQSCASASPNGDHRRYIASLDQEDPDTEVSCHWDTCGLGVTRTFRHSGESVRPQVMHTYCSKIEDLLACEMAMRAVHSKSASSIPFSSSIPPLTRRPQEIWKSTHGFQCRAQKTEY
jgi:hypothetical protein